MKRSKALFELATQCTPGGGGSAQGCIGGGELKPPGRMVGGVIGADIIELSRDSSGWRRMEKDGIEGAGPRFE